MAINIFIFTFFYRNKLDFVRKDSQKKLGLYTITFVINFFRVGEYLKRNIFDIYLHWSCRRRTSTRNTG